jgi:tetratricopeptide (TPR) repeat protein
VCAALLGACASGPASREQQSADIGNERFAAAFEHMRNEAYDEAESALMALARDGVQDAQLQLNLGIVYARTRRLDEALVALEEARALAPQSAAAHNELGIVLRQRGDFAGAAQAYRAAIAADPAYANAHYNLGVLLDLYLRQHAAALTHYETYLSLAQSEDKKVQAWVKDLRRRAATGPTTASSDEPVERR